MTILCGKQPVGKGQPVGLEPSLLPHCHNHGSSLSPRLLLEAQVSCVDRQCFPLRECHISILLLYQEMFPSVLQLIGLWALWSAVVIISVKKKLTGAG